MTKFASTNFGAIPLKEQMRSKNYVKTRFRGFCLDHGIRLLLGGSRSQLGDRWVVRVESTRGYLLG